MSIKVRFVTRKWEPAVGGMETYCVKLCKELEQYCEIEVISLSGNSDGTAPGLLGLIWFGLCTSVRLLPRSTVNVTHIGDVSCWPFAWLAKWRKSGGLVVISAHGSDISYADKATLLARLYRLYLAIGVKLVGRDLLIANSCWMAQLARKHGFSNTRVILLGTDYNRRTLANLVSHNGCVFYAGRIISSKGLEFFVDEALPLLNKGIRVRVAGVVGDPSQFRLLQHPQVDFLGALSTDELFHEFSSAMCVVVPSQSNEGFGLIAAEAACSGAVVVASSHSGLQEVCAGGVGQLVDAGSAAQWAGRIDEIGLWSESERVKHILVSSSLARERFDWKKVARETYQQYVFSSVA